MVCLVLCASFVQGVLGGLKFSNARAESVFRLLFLMPVLLDAYLMYRRSRAARPLPRWRMGVLVAPAAAVAALVWWVLHQRDAQGALFVLMLPFAHGALSPLLYLFSAAAPKQP